MYRYHSVDEKQFLEPEVEDTKVMVKPAIIWNSMLGVLEVRKHGKDENSSWKSGSLVYSFLLGNF